MEDTKFYLLLLYFIELCSFLRLQFAQSASKLLCGKTRQSDLACGRRGSEWTVSTAERQLTLKYPEDSPQDNDTYAEDGSAEDDNDTEDGSGRARFRNGGR